ncbi:SCP2 sterol-binding domain-containing protein [Alcaligenaceae bacterium]|nr:SCP2 sterol-binding domain-containing protein [Alcaligenaceae bacterium]
MFPFSLLPDPAFMHARILNMLLRREDWARERLSRHAGKTLRFAVGAFKTGFVLQSDGYVQVSDPAVVPDVILTVPAARFADLPSVLRSRDPAAIAAIMHVQGDAGLAQVVSDLARDLRWDVEDDLSRIVGDVAAARLTSLGRNAASGMQSAAIRLAGNVGEYLTEESGLMATRQAYDDWVGRLAEMRKRLDRLDARISALPPVPETRLKMGGR